MNETKEAGINKMVKLSNLELHRYYHTLSLTKRVEKAKFTKSRSYTSEETSKIVSLLTQLMKKSKQVVTYLKETDFSDNTYDLSKAKNKLFEGKDSESDRQAEEELEDSETD